MSVMSELHEELRIESGLPLSGYSPEVRVELVSRWLSRVEAQRLDTILAKYKTLTQGMPRREACRIWTEAFAVYCAFGGV